ncbi:hypothetical protein GF373_07460 [bacterium]|nr:hypothetical protein [bacterium]
MLIRFLIVFIGLFAPFGFAQEAEVKLPDSKLMLLGGHYEKDCLAVGDLSVYAIEQEKVKKILHGFRFKHEPKPILSPDREIVCVLGKQGRNENIALIYELGWRRDSRLNLTAPPSAWTFNPSSEKIAIATGTTLSEYIVETQEFTPLSLQTDSPIEAVGYSPDEEFLLVTTEGKSRLVKADSFEVVNTLPAHGVAPGKSRWLEPRKLAVLSGRGGPDSFVDVYTLSESGELDPTVPKRLASMGPSGRFMDIALSPYGKQLAIPTRILSSPVDFFAKAEEMFLDRMVWFKPVELKKLRKAFDPAEHWFAWSPKGGKFALIAQRYHAKPGHQELKKMNDVKKEWVVVVSKDLETFKEQPNPVYVSPSPLSSLCWSQDGKHLYVNAESGMGGMRKVLSFLVH